jgi:hypothetical protein
MIQRDFGSVSQNRVEVLEGTVVMLEGVDHPWFVQVKGTGTLASATMILYEGGADVSGSKLSGSMVISGRVIKSKVLTGLIGGSEYQAVILFTDDGVASARVINIQCLKLGVNPSIYQHSDYWKHRVLESPVMVLPSQSFNSAVSVEGSGAIGATPTMYAYKGTSIDNDVLSGSASATGRTISMKTISSLSGGVLYLIYLIFTDGGRNSWRYFEVLAPKEGAL